MYPTAILSILLFLYSLPTLFVGPFPPEIQLQIINSIEGMENTKIIRPGYDVEYDYVDPRSLKHNLETKQVGVI